MWQNNKTEIQITQNANFSLKIKQYLTLCYQVLQINQQILIYLPHVEQPARQAFQKLYDVQVTNRQSRDIKAIHLASAYFTTQDSERQYYLRDRFVGFLNKLRIVPPKIRILLQLEQIVREIKRGIEKIHYVLKNKSNKKDQSINIDGVISPNQVIKKCQQLSNAIKKLSQTSSTKKDSILKSTTKDKFQLEKFYTKQQFSLQQNFITILLWRYESCIIASLIVLQKQCKQRGLKFIKQTKKLIKTSLLNVQQVIKIYTFCLSNMCRKQACAENIEGYVYFQLELKKILGQRKNQLSINVKKYVQSALKKVKQVAQKQVLKKYAEKNENQIRILEKQRKINNFLQQSTEINLQKSDYLNKKTTNKYGINLEVTKSPKSSFTNQQFLATNRFSLTPMSKHVGLNSQNESQSLNKIKQYQLSLRKARELNVNNGKINIKIKGQTVRSMYDELGKGQKTQYIDKNGLGDKKFSNVSFRENQHTKRSLRPKSSSKIKNRTMNNTSKNTNHPHLTSRPMPFTQRLYQSLRQKNPHHQQITIMSLQNEIFMAPQVVYQKPKITFEQITRDLRFISQIKNDSESSTMGQVANEIIMARIQTKVKCMMILNGGDMLTIEIIKLKDEVQKFKCIIIKNQQFVTKVKFQTSQDSITLKSTKSTVQATDLFFQLMQNDINSLRSQATTKFLIGVNKLQQLERIDNQTYIGYYNIFNTISIIGDYIKPYVYWYWTRRSKMNGLTISRREKLQMSDPLKFSINLQSFKKNDLQGCIDLFKTVRNKKGLKQCISYLAQDRQILCRHLTKDAKGKYIIQIVQMQSKYMRNFEISSENQLIFPILKLTIKKYNLDQEYKTKNTLLIQRTFKKLFVDGSNRKMLKKKSNQIISQQTYPSQIQEKIDMRNILNNAQCNQLIINNLNQNYLPQRLILRMINYLENNLKKQQQQYKHIQKQIFTKQQQKKQRRIYEHETQQNKFDLKMTEQESTQNEYNDDLSQALRSYIVSIIGVENHQVVGSQQIDRSRRDERKNTRKFTQKMSNTHLLSMNNYTKQKYTLQYVINHKLVAFSNFLIAMSETYDQSMMFQILKIRTRNMKIGQKFYFFTIYRFLNECYLIVLKDNRSEKQWVMYVPQKMMRLVDCLMLGEEERQFCDQEGRAIKIESENQQRIQQRKIVGFNDIFIDMSAKKQKKYNSNQVSFLNYSDQSMSSSQSSSFSSQKQTKFETVQFDNSSITKKSHLFEIFNTQSQIFHLKLLRTPYLSKLTIHRKYTGKYFVNRVNSKNNKCSIMVSWMNIIERKIARLKDICYETDNRLGKYVYMACSYDVKFQYWRIDIYLPLTQQKFVSFVDRKYLSLQEKINQNKTQTKHIHKLLSNLLTQRNIQIHFQSHVIKIDQKPFKLFQTFDQLTLPHKDISLQLYESFLTQKAKTLNQMTLKKILNSQSHNQQSNSQQSVIKNSGLFQLLKYRQQIFLLLLDYKRNHILISELEQDPQYFFNNIYAQCTYKQTKNVVYQNLLRRTYQKVERNTIMLNETTMEEFGKVDL